MISAVLDEAVCDGASPDQSAGECAKMREPGTWRCSLDILIEEKKVYTRGL